MKVNLLILFVLLPVSGLYAADNAEAVGNTASAAVQAGEIVTDDAEGILEEPIGESVTEMTEPGVETISGAIDEDFVPSIQITEDLPVAFPVDI